MPEKLIIAGAGGFAIEVAEYLRQDIAKGALPGYELAGVLDDFPDQFYSVSGLPVPLLGSIQDYRFEPGELAIIAIGSPRGRKTVAQQLEANGAHFFSYIHSSAYVAGNASIGKGVIVCAHAVVNARSTVENFAAINVFSSVGHSAHVGAYSVLSPFSILNGDASIGSLCFLSTRATIFPRVHIGSECTVDAHSYVRTSVEMDGMIITQRSSYQVLKNRLP